MDLFELTANRTASLNGWKSLGEIGRGRYGVVYKIEKDTDISFNKHTAALKVVYYDALSEGRQDDYIQAINALRNERHAIAVEDYSKITISNNDDTYAHYLAIRMELLEPLPAEGLCQDEVLRLAAEMCNILMSCHGRKNAMYHCDIKPANILVAADGTYKLGDFGEAQFEKQRERATSECGTEGYRAPELYKYKRYDNRCDLYSLGITLYQLLNGGKMPFSEDIEASVKSQLAGKRLPKIPGVSREFMRIIRRLCKADPSKRFESARELRAALVPLIRKYGKKHAESEISAPESVPVVSETPESIEIIEAPELPSGLSLSETIPADYKRNINNIALGETIRYDSESTLKNADGTLPHVRTEQPKETISVDVPKRNLMNIYHEWQCGSGVLKGQYIPFHTRRMMASIAFVAAITCVLFFTLIRPNYAFVDGYFIMITSDNLDLSNKQIDDVSELRRCKGLEVIDLRGNSISFDDVDYLNKHLPRCKIIWDLPIGNVVVPSNTSSLDISKCGVTDLTDDKRFSYFTDLTVLDLTDCEVSFDEFAVLEAALPDCEIIWDVPIGDVKLRSDADAIYLRDIGTDNDADLVEKIDYFYKLTTLDLSGSKNLSLERLDEIKAELSTVKTIWEVEIDGSIYKTDKPAPVKVSRLDDAVLKKLQCLENIEYVEIVNSKLTDDECAALRKKYPQYNIRWYIELRGTDYSTETTSLDFSRHGNMSFAFPQVDKLKYFHKLTELKLNNNAFDSVEFLEPLVTLEKLELSNTECTDFSPIANLSGLKELDISLNTMDTLSFMQNLQKMEKLSLYGCVIRTKKIEDSGILENLWYLNVGRLDTLDWSFLNNFPNVEALFMTLDAGNIANIKVVNNLTKLKVLFGPVKNVHTTNLSDLCALVVYDHLYLAQWEKNSELRYLAGFSVADNELKNLNHLSNLQILLTYRFVREPRQAAINEYAPECKFHHLLNENDTMNWDYRGSSRSWESTDFFDSICESYLPAHF